MSNTAVIHHWSEELQKNEPVEIDESSILKLGIEHNPTTSVKEWMESQEAESLEDFAYYIDHELDFNVAKVR